MMSLKMNTLFHEIAAFDLPLSFNMIKKFSVIIKTTHI